MLYPFILTSLAGLATLIGIMPIFFNIKNTDKIIAISCSFAAGVMICISISDLIPESLKYLSINYNGVMVITLSFIFIIIGIITSSIMDKLVDKVSNGNNLFKIGIIAMIVIIIYNIPEDCNTLVSQEI